MLCIVVIVLIALLDIQTVNVECDRMDIYIMFLSSDLIIPIVSLGSVPYSLFTSPYVCTSSCTGLIISHSFLYHIILFDLYILLTITYDLV